MRSIVGCEGWSFTVDIPVLLLGIFLQVRRKEEVVGFDALQLLGHSFGLSGQVDGIMSNSWGIFFFLAP